MKLFYSVPSPFARKVLVVARETGMIDQIDAVECVLSPIAPNKMVAEENPVGKIPTLVLDDGMPLFDSRVICEYVDGLHHGQKMFPTTGGARWKALTLQALADGILDAAILVRYETVLRPEPKQWSVWMENQMQKIFRSLDRLETQIDTFGDTVDIGTIGVACAAGYLDFRFPDVDWRSSRPKLTEWFSTFEARPSMESTRP